jgi:uncharacterized membrane protein
MDQSLPTFSKRRLAGLIAILSFGLSSLFAVLGLGTVVSVTFILGFFILLPLIGLLGSDFPLVESSDDEPSADETTHDEDPLTTLRQRYANGEIDEAEFERRLELMLETEDVRQSTTNSDTDDVSDQLREIKRELE